MNLGFIGFGEAASGIAKGLSTLGKVGMFAFDIRATDPEFGPRIQQAANDSGVRLMPSLEQTLLEADVLCSLVGASSAVAVARDASGLVADKLWADMNTATPAVKREIASLIETSGGRFVDVAILGRVRLFGLRAPMVVSGSAAAEFLRVAAGLGMNVKQVGSEPGQAALLKLCRSGFTKGLSLLLMETLAVSMRYGVEVEVIESLQSSGYLDPAQVSDLVWSSAVHARRRREEMDDVLSLFHEAGMEAVMARATAELFDRMLAVGITSLAKEHDVTWHDAVHAFSKCITRQAT